MDIQQVANIAAIIGAVSILTTLIFVIFEIRANLRQFRSIKEISLHDVQNQFFLHWSQHENAKLIVKARTDFLSLNEVEKFAFENYVELRIRFFIFGFNFIQDPKTKPFQISRIKHFFSDGGTYLCYKNMVEELRIPPLWSEVIDASLANTDPDAIFKIALKGH